MDDWKSVVGAGGAPLVDLYHFFVCPCRVLPCCGEYGLSLSVRFVCRGFHGSREVYRLLSSVRNRSVPGAHRFFAGTFFFRSSIGRSLRRDFRMHWWFSAAPGAHANRIQMGVLSVLQSLERRILFTGVAGHNRMVFAGPCGDGFNPFKGRGWHGVLGAC